VVFIPVVQSILTLSNTLQPASIEIPSSLLKGICISIIAKLEPKFTFDIYREINAKGGIIKLQNENFDFDFLICDMQMPFNNDEGISIDAGCRVLERVKMLCTTGMKTTICSSDIKSKELHQQIKFQKLEWLEIFQHQQWKFMQVKQLHQSCQMQIVLL
jgi:CheY-like chemotaxis protein